MPRKTCPPIFGEGGGLFNMTDKPHTTRVSLNLEEIDLILAEIDMWGQSPEDRSPDSTFYCHYRLVEKLRKARRRLLAMEGTTKKIDKNMRRKYLESINHSWTDEDTPHGEYSSSYSPVAA